MTAARRKHLTIAAAPAPADAWRSELVANDKGKLLWSAHNGALILEHDPALAGLLVLDEFAQRIVYTRPAPWGKKPGDEFDECDAFELAAWIGHPANYEIACKPAQVAEAVEAVAGRHRVHPVRAYLDGLKWDGVERVASLFSRYCGAAESEYHAGAAHCFMVSAVARIFRPGCKVDHMLVLEGAQGGGKTSAVRTLFGGDRWYVDCQRSPADKDFYQDLNGKWGAEVGEMTSFSKAEHGKVKQTLTAQADVYRPSYGRYSRTFPRQCVFVGTTNEDAWQRDPTGGRRYLPVRVSAVDFEALTADRDQLWAEAVMRFHRGDPWWNLPARAAAEQDERYADDSWTEPVLRWLSGRADERAYESLRLNARDKQQHVVECTATEILLHALHVDLARHDRAAATRVGVIMSRLGWPKFRPTRFGSRQWCWYAPDDWEWPDAA